MIAHGRNANPGTVSIRDTSDGGARRNKITEIELHKGGREIYVSIPRRIDSHAQRDIARPGLEAFRRLDGSGMSDQHELSAKAHCERARERDHHNSARCATQLTG